MPPDADLLLHLAETLDVEATLEQCQVGPERLREVLIRSAAVLMMDAPVAPAGEVGGPYTAFTDGAARGNPGPAGAGFALYRGETLVESQGQYLGQATNDQAQCQALIMALGRALEFGADELTVKTGSELMARQLNGPDQDQNQKSQELLAEATQLISKFKSFQIQRVGRERNLKAGQMANRAIDEFKND